MTRLSWVALHGMAHSFTELDKAVVSVWLVFCDCGFHSVCRFPGGSDGKAPACNAAYPGLIPGSGRSPGEGNGNPLQHSYLENPIRSMLLTLFFKYLYHFLSAYSIDYR